MTQFLAFQFKIQQPSLPGASNKVRGKALSLSRLSHPLKVARPAGTPCHKGNNCCRGRNWQGNQKSCNPTLVGLHPRGREVLLTSVCSFSAAVLQGSRWLSPTGTWSCCCYTHLLVLFFPEAACLSTLDMHWIAAHLCELEKCSV